MEITTLAQEIRQQRPFRSQSQEVMLGIIRTAALIRHRMDKIVATKGLTAQQYNVLRILRGFAKPMPTMDIASRLLEPTPGISRLIARLEKLQLVKRHVGEQDKRQVFIILTDQARELLDQIDPEVHQFDEMFNQVENLGQLSNQLDQIRAQVRSYE